VFVPYCTGDFHLGTRRMIYSAPAGDTRGGVSVNHAGYFNVRSVLDYLSTREPKARLIVVSGASAGAIASPVVAGEVARRFPNAAIRQIGDGVAAIRVPQTRALLRQWGVDSLVSALGLSIPASADPLVGMYKTVAAQYPRVRFSQVSTSADAHVALWWTIRR
jgi:hypothetical protein